MKLSTNLVRTAVAAALSAGFVHSAFALVPSDFTAGERAANILRFSGATSTDTAIQELMILTTNGICATGTTNIFLGTSQRAILCTGTGAGVGGQHIAYLKESTAGSENGSRTVGAATVQSLPYLDVFGGTFACGGADNNVATNDAGTYNPGSAINVPRSVAAVGAFQAYGEYSNCTPTLNASAEAGISDIETRFFGTDGGKATADPQFEVMFGVPVSLNLYRALQAAQGISAKSECDGVVDGTLSTSKLAGDTTGGSHVANTGIDGAGERDLPECAPSLDRSTIAQLYSGALFSWDQLTYPTTPNGSTFEPLTSFGSAPAPVSSDVYICRRGDDSGTQRGTQAYFLRQGCGGSDAFLPPSTGGGTVNAPITYADGNAALVVAGKESGDVRNCLDDRDDTNRFAIGVLSMDSTVSGAVAIRPGAGGGGARLGNLGSVGGGAKDTDGGTDAAPAEAYQREFRFVRISGELPSLEVVANGGYEFVTENVCYNRTGAVTGVEGEIYNRICKGGLVSRINALNEAADNQPWGDGAYLLIPKGTATTTPNALPVTQLAMESNPVNGWTKQFSAFNNCNITLPFTEGPFPPTPAGPVGPEDANL